MSETKSDDREAGFFLINKKERMGIDSLYTDGKMSEISKRSLFTPDPVLFSSFSVCRCGMENVFL